ncbi:MAG: N-acetyl-gamma-glutamyl-phosphate reductase [Deltaproteobacteria bacterium]|nr:MAG: N-acetyl-gamma-glutamyl-phosphate reductase [Deltaproteobacteria bacterium]
MVRVGIYGATGYTGLELYRRISVHPGAEVVFLTSEQYAGKKLTDVFPFAPPFPRPLVSIDDAPSKGIDAAFLALPHTVSMKVAPGLLDAGVRVIDLSADFRHGSPEAYRENYGVEHSAPGILGEAVYGLCELNRDAIRDARIVAAPGCFPASIILPLYPLLREGVVKAKGIVADSKTGVSGGGRAPKLNFHYPEVEGGIFAYGFPRHRHNGEIEEVLSQSVGREVTVTFVPHLAPMVRGILSTIYAPLEEGAGPGDVGEAFRKIYDGEPFILLLGEGVSPSTKFVAGSNLCAIGYQLREEAGLLVLLSAVDNLVKGASGSAVQCFNVMFGFDEKTALDEAPLFP